MVYCTLQLGSGSQSRWKEFKHRWKRDFFERGLALRCL